MDMKRKFDHVRQSRAKWILFLLLCTISTVIFAVRIFMIDQYKPEHHTVLGYYILNGVPLFFSICGMVGFGAIIERITNP